MKVLLLTEELLPGGISRHVTDIANAFEGTDIYPYVASTPGDFLSRLSKKIPFLPLNLLKPNSYRKNLLGLIPSCNKLSDLIEKERIDVIHSHKRFSHAIGMFLAKRFRLPHITSYHSDFADKKMLTVFGDYTTCCSDAVRNQVVNRFGCEMAKAQTIYYGIHSLRKHSVDEKKSTLEKLNITAEKKIISSVGQFIPVKDRISLITAVNDLRTRRDITDLVFLLLGHGEQKLQLQAFINKLQLERNVFLIGGTFDVESLFNVSEFMILNSLNEGFGIVMLEAASIGKVHIGTNVGGIPEFIEHNVTGILVEKENPEQLADAIHSMLENPVQRVKMEQAAKVKYETHFRFEEMLKQIINVYRNVYTRR